MSFFDNLVNNLSVTTLGGLFISQDDRKKSWETKDCIVYCPRQPEFTKLAKLKDGGEVYPLDIALTRAKEYVLLNNGNPGMLHAGRKNKKCEIYLATTEELATYDKSEVKYKYIYQGLTIRELTKAKILVNKLIPEWLGHELYHWAEWYMAHRGNEILARKYEALVGSLLNKEVAVKYLDN